MQGVGTQPRSQRSWKQRVNLCICVPQAHIHTQTTGLNLAPPLFFNSIPILAWLFDCKPQGSPGIQVPMVTRA